jgi:hypothetical protein
VKRLILICAAAAATLSAQAVQVQPTLNVELTVYLLSGAAQGTADDVPQDLASTVKQLHSVFSYKSYKLRESLLLRGRASDGGAQASGALPGSNLQYSFSYKVVRVSDKPPRMLHIDGLDFQLYPPRKELVASIKTDLDLADGQKTVIGKSSFNDSGDALILVIVPKVID